MAQDVEDKTIDQPQAEPQGLEGVPALPSRENPWLKPTGISQDDPLWDAMMEEIYEMRRRQIAEVEAEIRDEERAPLYAAMVAPVVLSDLTEIEGKATMTQEIKSRVEVLKHDSSNGHPARVQNPSAEVPLLEEQDSGVIPNHPLAKIIGVFKDNPVLDDVMEEIYEMRRRQIAEVEAEIRDEERKVRNGKTP